MAHSSVTYTGDGVITQRAVTFPFITKSHVLVHVNAVNTAFTWVNDAVVNISPAPANGTTIKIFRTTPVATPIVDFSNASTLTESDLDKAHLQNLYCIQEVRDHLGI